MIKIIAEISSWLLNWIKKIFHIHSKSKKDDKIIILEHEDKKNEQGKLRHHKPPDIPPGATTVSLGPTAAQEKTQKEGGGKSTQKPYVVSPPTKRGERGETKEITTPIEKPGEPKLREIIYLGNAHRRKPRPPKIPEEVDNHKNKPDTESPKDSITNTIESPFIEIDLDRLEVYLILPRQRFSSTELEKIPSSINYIVKIHEDIQKVPSKISPDKEGIILTEEKRILIGSPLRQVKVIYPAEVEERVFNYNHNDDTIYMFAAIGNNRGRMIYLFDEDGKINPLSKKYIWILLRENFELQAQPDLIEERWFWDNYRPYRINLGKFNNLEIMNKTSGETKSFSVESTFYIEGEQLIEDDFRRECPLFTDKTLKIIAPHKNSSGWNVWIQNKITGFKVKENWNGGEPLILNLPKDLPCDCGEFQIDICQKDIRIPEEILFFRWIPNIELDWTKKLIISDASSHDMSSAISIKSDSNIEWELKVEGGERVEKIEGNNYRLQLPAERDTVRFSIVKSGKLETITHFQITIPRLKWKTSKQDRWDWKPQRIERRELRTGEPFYLLIRTNDIDDRCDFKAILETEGQPVQDRWFVKKGMEYTLELNLFYDTIRHYKSELNLKVEICQKMDNLVIGKVDILHFPSLLIRCRVQSCSFASYNMIDIKAHFQEQHFENFIEHLTYEELREHDRSLPYMIYQCAYCEEYISGNSSTNPTSSILRHVEREHHIRMHPHYRIISNIGDIRDRVFPNLREIYKCSIRICGEHFEGYTREMQIGHFFDQHSDEVFEYLED